MCVGPESERLLGCGWRRPLASARCAEEAGAGQSRGVRARAAGHLMSFLCGCKKAAPRKERARVRKGEDQSTKGGKAPASEPVTIEIPRTLTSGQDAERSDRQEQLPSSVEQHEPNSNHAPGIENTVSGGAPEHKVVIVHHHHHHHHHHHRPL